MKLFSILTALVVVGALYAMVFERDRVMTFAGIGSEDAADTGAPSGTPPSQTGMQTANKAEETVRRVSVVGLTSTAQTIDSAVVLRGRTEASRQVSVSAEVSGRVISKPLRRGAKVSEGMALCELDRGTMETSLIEARAWLVEAEINARAASKLADGGFGSVTRRVAAEAALEAARAVVERAEESLTDTVMTAPFDGVLEEDTAELGAFLAPGSGAGAHCATILQLDPIKVVGFVPELQVTQIAPGAPATARLADGREFTGRVSFLSRSAEETTRTFRVEIEIANPDLSIRAGQTAGVGVAADGAIAHLLPASALTLNDAGRLGVRHVVETDQGQEAAFAEVEVVRDTIDGIWLSGLPEQLTVIVVGQDFVTAGTPLDVTLREPEA